MKNGLILALCLMMHTSLAHAQSPFAGMSAEQLSDGERLFRIHCARCHGIDGVGGEGSNLARANLKFVRDDESLINVINEGIPGTGMPAIWSLDDEQTNRVAAYVRTLGRLAAEEMPGDPIRGARVYQNRGGCPACHIVAGYGVGIGPELTHIGDQRGMEYLRTSLTDPASTQSQTSGYKDYLTVRVQTADRRVEGLRVNEDAFSIQVRDVSGTVHSFRKDELIAFEKIFSHSLMPEYGDAVSRQDLDDVVSYLMSLGSE